MGYVNWDRSQVPWGHRLVKARLEQADQLEEGADIVQTFQTPPTNGLFIINRNFTSHNSLRVAEVLERL